MTYSYSPSTKGFYCFDINGENIPSDAIKITDEQYQTLLYGIHQGQTIEPDANDNLILIGEIKIIPITPTA